MIFNLDSRRYLAEHPRWAVGCFERMRGMIGRDFIPGEFDAMVFPRCNAVHSMWMTIPIDVVFIDADFRVVELRVRYRPWQFPAVCRRAVTVIELPVGRIVESGTRPGHRINLNSNLDEDTLKKLCGSAYKAGCLPRSAEPLKSWKINGGVE